jgi:hypothetical protein
MYKEHLLVDPTAEEEAVAGSSVTVVLDASASLHGEGACGQAGVNVNVCVGECVCEVTLYLCMCLSVRACVPLHLCSFAHLHSLSCSYSFLCLQLFLHSAVCI